MLQSYHHAFLSLQYDNDATTMSAPLSMAGVSEKDLKDDHDPFDKSVLKSFTKKKAINTRLPEKNFTLLFASNTENFLNCGLKLSRGRLYVLIFYILSN